MKRFSIIAAVTLGLCLPIMADDLPFDRLDRDVGQYLDRDDPLSFAAKVKSVSADPYVFWRGTKGLFFQWSKTNCADWLADRDAYVISHGDLHLGNIGTYATGDWGHVAFGMVDFDESARLPFQIELLQGIITFDLLAKQNNIALSSSEHQAIIDTLLDSYRTALISGKPANESLATNAAVRDMFATKPADYAKDLRKYVRDDRFIRGGDDAKAKNILQPVDYTHFDSFAAAIVEAAHHDTRLAALLRWDSEPAVRGAIKDVSRRMRVGSSGSQGLAKYFVLLKTPFRNYDGDVILYFKRQIPTAAERSGAIPTDPRSPGERYVEDMARLTNPPALFSSWADMDGGSYWVSLKEPWSNELSYSTATDFDSLRNLALIWGTTAGAGHAGSRNGSELAAKLTPDFRRLLLERAAAYAWENDAAFNRFVSDPRTTRCIEAADRAAGRVTKSQK